MVGVHFIKYVGVGWMSSADQDKMRMRSVEFGVKKPMSFDYFLGLIDGEGSFIYYGRGGVDVFSFRLGMHIRDTEMVLAVKRLLGFGLVFTGKRNNPRHGDAVVLSVTKKDDLRNLIKRIDEAGQFIGYKNYQYLVWREAFMRMFGDESKFLKSKKRWSIRVRARRAVLNKQRRLARGRLMRVLRNRGIGDGL